MRKILSALAGGALAVTLFAPAAHAARPTSLAQQVRPQSEQLNGDDGDEDHHHRRHDGDDDDDGDGILERVLEVVL